MLKGTSVTPRRDTANFDLVRSRPVVSFFDRDFRDTGLSIEPRENITQEIRNIVLPNGITDFEDPILVHSFWNRARIQINLGGTIWPSFPDDDTWQLSRNEFSESWLQAGTNQLLYYRESPTFIEKPGPMFFMQRKANVGSDNAPPTVYNHAPTRGEVDVDVDTNIEFQLFDGGAGVDKSTIQLQVNGVTVTPTIIGSKHSYFVLYNPSSDFIQGADVAVAIDACDLGGRCMNQDSYTFTIFAPPVASDVDSDDFNRCSDPQNSNLWIFRNPQRRYRV